MLELLRSTRARRLLMTPICLGIAVALLAAPTTAADRAVTAGEFALTKNQIARIEALNQTFDAPIKEAFKSNPKLQAALTADLKAIEAIKDTGARIRAAKAYQTKYGSDYKNVLSAAKVDLKRWAAGLQAIAPAMRFVVADSTHVVGTAVDQGLAAPAGLVLSRVITLRSSDFEFSSESTCGGGAGGSAERSGLKLTSWVTAAVLGGCQTYGTLSHTFEVPPGQKARLQTKISLSASGIAVAVVGVALAHLSADLYVGDGSLDGNGLQVQDPSVSCIAVAPFLWVATCDSRVDDVPVEIDISEAGSYTIRTYGGGDAFAGAVSVTGGGTEGKLADVKLAFGAQ